MFPVPLDSAPARPQSLTVASRAGRFAAMLRERLAKPLRDARHSLASRINLAAIGMIFLLAMLGIAVAIAMVQLAARTEQGRVLREASLASTELTAAIAESRYYASRFAVTGENAGIEKAQATLDQAKQSLVETRDNSADVDQQAREAMEWLQYQVEGFENELSALEHSIAAHGPSASGDALAEAIDISGEQLADQARGVEGNLANASAASDAGLVSLTRWLATVVIGLLLVCIAITVIGARFVTRTTAGPIREITAAMSGLALGDRSVAIPGTERLDEIGAMARALAVFRKSAEDLAHLQEHAAESARQELARQEADRTRRAELMREVAQRFERTVGEVVSSVAAASEQLQMTAASMAAAAGQSAQLTGEVSHSMKETTAGVTAAAAASDQFALSVGEISRQASSSAALAQDARRSALGADGTIAVLASTAAEIGQIVQTIDSIAQRTTLLALNASIEAARSGAAGRGFAVVAGEVKDLAGQTSAATQDVAAQIRAIQDSTGETVAALRRIGEQVREMESSAIAIAQSVDEQTVASQDLARNLAKAAGGTDVIGHSVGQVSEMAQSTGAAASQVLDSASELHQQAAVLRAQVDEFLGYVRAA